MEIVTSLKLNVIMMFRVTTTIINLVYLEKLIALFSLKFGINKFIEFTISKVQILPSKDTTVPRKVNLNSD